MRIPPKKASLLRLQVEDTVNRVTQAMMRELETAQQAEWAASKRAAILSETIKAALKRGVPFEDGPLYFDIELEMVRSRKAADAG